MQVKPAIGCSQQAAPGTCQQGADGSHISCLGHEMRLCPPGHGARPYGAEMEQEIQQSWRSARLDVPCTHFLVLEIFQLPLLALSPDIERTITHDPSLLSPAYRYESTGRIHHSLLTHRCIFGSDLHDQADMQYARGSDSERRPLRWKEALVVHREA